MRPARRLGAVLLAVASLGAPRALGAQETVVDSAAPRPAPPGTGGWGAVDVAPRPRTTVVSVTVAFPRGSSRDPEDAPGAAWLLAHTIRRMVLDGLDASARASTEVGVEIDRSRTLFRMVTLPRYWVDAYDALEWALLGAAVPADATERARADIESTYVFEEDAPHREFDVELYRLLSSAGSPWSRTPRGTEEGMQALTPADLTVLRGRLLPKAEGVVSVVGAVDPAEAARTVADGPTLPDDGVVAPGFTPLEGRDEEPSVWDEGIRVPMTREVTSTWIAAAFPVDPDTPSTALDMLVHQLDREFNPSPPDPGTFDVEVRLEFLGTHRLLVVEAAVVPEAASAWERRIRDAIGRIADDELERPYFATYRRRFRAARLLKDAAPEAESARRALDLMVHGRVRDLPGEISALEPDDLQEAADDLGEPRILVFGPDLGDGSSW